MLTIDNYIYRHYIQRNNWLGAAVHGANDGIISILSIAIGVAAASSSREPWLYGFTIYIFIFLGALAAKVGGSSIPKAILRIKIWDKIAMGFSALVVYILGIRV